MSGHHVLTLSCPDRPGLTSAVTGRLFQHRGNVVEAEQFGDSQTERFFMRIVADFADHNGQSEFQQDFAGMAASYDMEWSLQQQETKRRVLIFVSRFDHCLNDLLYRYRTGEMLMDLVGIVSNHPAEALHLTGARDIPYYHLPITKETKLQQEEQIKALIEETGAELCVLARYMQILSDDLAGHLSGKCINIHHSFLPGFKGARPYHQAHARGVKMIGATAHYVTADLDEGPIIVQEAESITHADSPEDLIRKGRDIERRVLARAVRYHLEDRVLLNGQKTVVFGD